MGRGRAYASGPAAPPDRRLSSCPAAAAGDAHLETGAAEGLAAAGRLAGLRRLELSGLQLQRLPGWLCGLAGLVQLDAGGNRQLGRAVLHAAASERGVVSEAPAGAAGGEGGVAEPLAVLLQLHRLRCVRLAGCDLPEGCLAGVVAAARGRGVALQCAPPELAQVLPGA